MVFFVAAHPPHIYLSFKSTSCLHSAQVDCVYLDFSKEFDKVNHCFLVAKMEGYGVGGSLLDWI